MMIASNAYSRGLVGLTRRELSASVAARHTRAALSVMALVLVAATPARSVAGPPDDGYCDYIEGAAAATAAPLIAPQLFAQFGYIEQPSFAVAPSGDASNLRVLGGVRYSLTNIYAAMATKSRARAECERHRALVTLGGVTTARALGARIKIYDDAQPEAERILRELEAQVEAAQATAQELLATRLRVEELRTLATNARRELAALPPASDRPVATLLSAFRSADGDVERSDRKLRTIRAYDFNVRVGADRFLDGANQELQFFGVVELGVNLGAFWVGKANDRAAAGRRRYVRSDPQLVDAVGTVEQLRTTLALEQKLVAQTEALVADLDRQLKAVAQVGGQDGKRFRETVWFAWVKASADLAYQRARIEALREVLGADAR